MSTAAQIVAANELAWLSWTTNAEPVDPWLRQRGLDPAAITAAGHQLGWAGDSWNDLTNLLARHKVPTRVAIDAGLVRPRAKTQVGPSGGSGSSRTYDSFRGRVIAPIRDIIAGRILGFTARRHGPPDERIPKYLNSPTSAAFRKGDLLFGAWEARQRLLRDRATITSLVVCEGLMDVLNVAASGPWVAVAACGTALTASQAGWIIALSQAYDLPVQLAYDGDPAGQRASARAWDLLSDSGARNVGVAVLPTGNDPADLASDTLADALIIRDGVSASR